MFNLGFSELIVVAVIALIFIGPQQLPEVARMIGRLLNEWKRATTDLKSTFTEDMRVDLQPRRREEPAQPDTPPVVKTPSGPEDSGDTKI